MTKTTKIERYTVAPAEKVFINGVIVPIETEDIYLDSTKGTLNKIYIKDGQIVKKGDKLFDYKNESITEQIHQLKIQLNTYYKQKKQLIEKKHKAKLIENTSALESEMSSYEDQLISVENQISSSEEQISALKKKEYSEQLAPIDGRIILNTKEKSLQSPYITIESVNYYISGTINEKDQPKLKIDQTTDILIFSTNKTVTGKIRDIADRPEAAAVSTASAVNGASNVSNYNVKIALDSQENLTNGFHVQAVVKLTEGDVKIPRDAILQENNTYYVFKVIDKKLTKQFVTYIEEDSDKVNVMNGLQESDEIVKNPTLNMKEGMAIE